MELRGENQETYYNIGRALHQLGKALSIYLDIKIKFFNIVLLKTVLSLKDTNATQLQVESYSHMRDH